jgi:hypothetical protein
VNHGNCGSNTDGDFGCIHHEAKVKAGD